MDFNSLRLAVAINFAVARRVIPTTRSGLTSSHCLISVKWKMKRFAVPRPNIPVESPSEQLVVVEVTICGDCHTFWISAKSLAAIERVR